MEEMGSVFPEGEHHGRFVSTPTDSGASADEPHVLVSEERTQSRPDVLVHSGVEETAQPAEEGVPFGVECGAHHFALGLRIPGDPFFV